MDVQRIKALLKGTVLLFLTGCASLPAQDFKFFLNANSPGQSSWSQKGLTSTGSLVFKFRLQQTAGDAASVKITFKSLGVEPSMIVRISDKHCVGAYTISIQYIVNSRETHTAYLKTRLLWDEDSTLSIQWGKKGRASLSVNALESQVISLSQGVRSVRVDVSSGGLDVSELTYRAESPTLN